MKPSMTRALLPVTLGRDDRFDSAFGEIIDDGVAVVAFVGDECLWSGTGFIHDRRVALHFGSFAAGQDHGDR